MALTLVTSTRTFTKRVDRSNGSTEFTQMYECTMSCGHRKVISGLTRGAPPKKLKCKACTKDTP